MDAIFEVLLIVGLIGFGVISQIRKVARESQSNTNRQPPVSIPDIPEDYYPQVDFDTPPPPPPITVQQFKSQQKKSTPIIFKPMEEMRQSPLQETEDINQEFDIHSPEEVRKGIIWSEILNRKY